jgi:hypothetical protein
VQIIVGIMKKNIQGVVLTEAVGQFDPSFSTKEKQQSHKERYPKYRSRNRQLVTYIPVTH